MDQEDVEMVERRSWLMRVGDALSQLINVMLFNGGLGMGVSGDAYRMGRVRLEKAIDWVFSRIELAHCYYSYRRSVARADALLREHCQTHPKDTYRFNDLVSEIERAR